MKKPQVFEFRCPVDHSLLAKTHADSKLEIKCKKCGFMNYYIQGTSFLEEDITETFRMNKNETN